MPEMPEMPELIEWLAHARAGQEAKEQQRVPVQPLAIQPLRTQLGQ
jgi:hypothetical protein